MAVRPLAPTPTRRARATSLLRVAIAALALLAPLASAPARDAAAQAVVATTRPSVTATGTGTASAPAAAATVQIVIGRGGRQFGFSRDASSSGAFESMRGEFEDGSVEAVTVGPEGTPQADEAAERRGREGRNRRSRSRPVALTNNTLAPIVQAVATAAGVDPDAVKVDLSPLATEPFGERAESARLDLTVAQPTPQRMTDVVTAASDAAAASGLVVEVVGVRYDPADCGVVEGAAEQAAIADARKSAERLAGFLGVTLGGVVSASNVGLYGFGPSGPDEGGCHGQQGAYYDSGYGGLGLTVPVFDPSQSAAVTVTSLLTISYEIAAHESGPAGASATPAPTA
jgi:hypothetical protein